MLPTIDEIIIDPSNRKPYELSFEGRRWRLTARQLLDRREFSIRYLAAVHRAPTMPDRSTWVDTLNQWLRHAKRGDGA